VAVYGVTGGAGFIGGHVVDALIAAGHTPVVFDHLGRRRDDGVEVMLGDIRDATAVSELAAHVDGIVHLAACLGTQETIRNPRPAADTNITGGLNVLEALAAYDIPGVYIAVGNHFMNNSYSITKTTIERFARMYNTERGVRCNVVRAVNAYGPQQSVAPPFGPAKVRKITPAFVCRALVGEPVEIYGDGQQVSDMVHVRDVARTLVAALECAAAGMVVPTVECGPVDHHTVRQVAEQVLIESGCPMDDTASRLRFLPMRPGEIPGATVIADTETLWAVGVDPAGLIPLADGVAETVKWFRENWLPGYLAQAA
jgi:nucleoside-diphosphate-sugar epimerase